MHFLWVKSAKSTSLWSIGIPFVLLKLVEISLGRERDLHPLLATERFAKEAMCVVLTWSAGKCSLVTSLIFAFAYTAGGRAPVLSCVLAPHCSLLYWTVILRPLLYGLFFFCKRISRQWSHELCIFERHTLLWHRVVRGWMVIYRLTHSLLVNYRDLPGRLH